MKRRAFFGIVLLVAALSLAASLGGLLLDSLYRDKSAFVLSAWRVSDWVTLVVALPLLLLALIFAWKGSARGRIVLMGMLYFVSYNYAYYLFGAAFNLFFPVYALLVVLPVVGLIFGLQGIDYEAIRRRTETSGAARWVSLYMFLWAAILAFAWIGQWAVFVADGQVPQIVTDSGGSTNLVAAIDLSLVVPVVVASALLLWRRRPWGYLLAAMSNVQGAVYTVVLMAGSFEQWTQGPGGPGLLGLWIFLFLGCLGSSVVLLTRTWSTRGGDTVPTV